MTYNSIINLWIPENGSINYFLLSVNINMFKNICLIHNGNVVPTQFGNQHLDTFTNNSTSVTLLENLKNIINIG